MFECIKALLKRTDTQPPGTSGSKPVSNFARAFEIIVGVEGALSVDPNDKGNWTGGQIGAGELKGTKYGISAASYPDLDIVNLTLEQAGAIYKRDYWDAWSLDTVPWDRALVTFDAAVQHRPDKVREWLAAVSQREFVVEFQAERALYYAALAKWPDYGRGWMRRLIRISLESQKT